MSTLGVLKSSNIADLADGASWVKSAAGVTVTAASDGIIVDGPTWLEPVVTNHQTHLLNDWTMEVTLGDAATLTSDFQLAIGIKDKQTTNNLHTMWYLEGSTQRAFFKAANLYPTSCIKYLPAGFNWTNAKIKVHYRDNYITIAITNPVGQYFTHRYRFCLKIYNPDGSLFTPQGHSTMPVGGFALYYGATSATSNRVKSVKIISDAVIRPDFLINGDSQVAARQCFPESLGFGYLLDKKFRAANDPRIIVTHGAGASHVHHMTDILPSILAQNPKAFINGSGDNDSRLNIAAYQADLIELINGVTAAGIKFYYLAGFPDPNDNHDPFWTWAQDPAGLKASVAHPSLLRVIDTFSPLCTGGSWSTPNAAMRDAHDNVHLTPAAHVIWSNTIYNYIVADEALPAYDADAQAFFDVLQISGDTLDLIQKEAVNQLVIDLKNNGTWSLMLAIYCFVGGTSAAHKWNLKDPRDLDAAFRLTFYGSPTHSPSGVAPNGVNQYADTHISPHTLGLSGNLHLGYYSLTTAAGGEFEIASADNIETGTVMASLFTRRTGGDSCGFDSGGFPEGRAATTSVANGSGDYVGASCTTSERRLYRNGSLIADSTTTATNTSTATLYLFAANDAATGTAKYFGNKACAMVTIGYNLTGAQVATRRTAIQSYQTRLSRQV